MIDKKESEIVEQALETALKAGAQKARISYSKNEEDMVATLNSEVDRISRSVDRSISLALFVDGRYGSFSSNDLETESLKNFIHKSVDLVRSITPDLCRDLPAPERCCKEAKSGNELGLLDSNREKLSPEARIDIALQSSVFHSVSGEKFKLLSEEGEYSDSQYDSLLMDSNGLCCRHSETSFDYSVEATIEYKGEKYSSHWWESSPAYSEGDFSACGRQAVARAASHIGSSPAESGRYNMVIDTEVASKMVSPLLQALNASYIQQNNSFLADSLGECLFHEGFKLMDLPRIAGQSGSRLFDSEGVATKEAAIIENGTVRQYFINTYMSKKLNMEPNIGSPTRVKLLPWPELGLTQEKILRICGKGILVTGFNGGNCNPATGDFSYGIEGFLFENSKIVRPVGEMLVSGNFLELWKNFIASGEDFRTCQPKLIPTIAFSDVAFSG